MMCFPHCSTTALQWCHNERDGISNCQPHDCLLSCLFRHRSKKTSNLHVPGLCEGNSLVTGEFPAQRASNTENVSIWWCHHGELHYQVIFDCVIMSVGFTEIKPSFIDHDDIQILQYQWNDAYHYTSNAVSCPINDLKILTIFPYFYVLPCLLIKMCKLTIIYWN